MSGIGLQHFLGLAALLFCIGLYGVLSRRNAIGILMGIELMLNACNINLVAFARFVRPEEPQGQMFALFVMGLAACEAAVGLAIILAVYRTIKSVNVDEINILKW
ncbi:MAG: NADH-quinone oxidoreductase subunit NuoK [Armatimonadota bacterium]